MTDSAGTRLRKSIEATYDLTLGEMVLLDQAVVLADTLERVNAAVAALADLEAVGSAGQAVEHPLLKSQRDYSALLARIVDALKLPLPGAEADTEGESATTRAARHAARVRWEGAR